MKLTGRRTSSNVDDRRGVSGKAVAGGGSLLVAAIVGIFTYMQTGSVVSGLSAGWNSYSSQPKVETGSGYTPTKEDEEKYQFAAQILAGTEDVWTEIFKNSGMTYKAPKMVVFRGSVSSACGNATSESGPFYCSGDQAVYIDLDFFDQLENNYGAKGDFAKAYVIAHEVGHHVQYLLGTLQKVSQQQSRMSQVESNKLNIRLELQADFFAGVWAHHDNAKYNSMEVGDIEEGLNAASKIGDDYLQQQAYGRTQPETFNHGTSAQRSRWLKRGFETGDPGKTASSIFELPDAQL